jgi:hypothetical protein
MERFPDVHREDMQAGESFRCLRCQGGATHSGTEEPMTERLWPVGAFGSQAGAAGQGGTRHEAMIA